MQIWRQNVNSDTMRLMGQPSKKSKKRSVALLEDSIQLICVSQDSHTRKSILRRRENIGIKSHHQVLQGHVAPHQIRESKGPSRGIIPKCETHERNPCAPRLEERAQDETLDQERCAHRLWTRTSKSPEERELVVEFGASMQIC